MGFFSWLSGGGNVGMIAKSIARQHRSMGDFNAVLDVYFMDFSSRQNGSRNFDKAIEAVRMISKDKIRNYRDLSILSLFVDSSSANHSYYEVSSYFSDEVSKYLSQNGIDEHHISGDLLGKRSPTNSFDSSTDYNIF